MAYIEKRGNGYRVEIRGPDGAKVRKTFRLKADARAWARSMESSRDAGAFIDPRAGRITFGEFFEAYIAEAPLRPQTRATYRSIADTHLLPVFGRVPLNRVTQGAVSRLLASMTQNGVGAARVNGTHRVLRRVLNQAIAEMRLGANPAVGVHVPRAPKAEVRPLTAEQVERLATEARGYGTLVRTLAWTGIRIGEACELRVKDLDLLRRRLTVSRSASLVERTHIPGPTKTGRARMVRLPAFLAEELGRSLEGRKLGPESLVFVNEKGQQIRRDSFRLHAFRPAAKRAGLDPIPRIHDLRHTAAALMARAGYHPKVVQEALGHSSIMVTFDIYGTMFDTLGDEAAGRLDALWSTAQLARS
jgi:integrase